MDAQIEGSGRRHGGRSRLLARAEAVQVPQYVVKGDD